MLKRELRQFAKAAQDAASSNGQLDAGRYPGASKIYGIADIRRVISAFQAQGAPLPSRRETSLETLTFYSYKGEAGGACYQPTPQGILRCRKKVVAIDFDFEAPGLHYKMQIGRSELVPAMCCLSEASLTICWRPLKKQDRHPDCATTSRLFHYRVAQKANSFSCLRALRHLANTGGLSPNFFSGAFSLTRTVSASHHALNLKLEFKMNSKPITYSLNLRTGITELAGVATTLLADKVICLVINNQESLAGARAVMRSFGRAPRLKNQKPIQLFPVLSRISNAQSHTRNDVLKYLNAASDNDTEKLDLKQLYLLSVDTELENEEKLHVGGEKQSGSRLYRDYLALFEAMVSSKSAQSASAARRYDAITRMREFLTELRDGNCSSRSTPDSFNQKEIDEGVTLGKYEKRYADLVAYSAGDRTEALLAAEYVDDLKDSDAWQWWEKNTQLRCVILFSIEKDSYLDRRVFTRGRRGGKFVERENYDGWIVRWPVSFKALDDPGDRSVSAMLKAVQHGEESFIELLVREWEHSATSTLHGGAPFRPYRSRQILMDSAQVTDPEIETQILWRTLPDPFHRDFERRMKGGGASDDQMIRELHAPLWWRLSVKAKIEVYGSHRRGPMGGNSLSEGMDFLCRDIMGLSVNEDGEVRREVRHISVTIRFTAT